MLFAPTKELQVSDRELLKKVNELVIQGIGTFSSDKRVKAIALLKGPLADMAAGIQARVNGLVDQGLRKAEDIAKHILKAL